MNNPTPAYDSDALNWRKSTFSGDAGCVEIADLPGGGRAMRDSKLPNSPVLEFTGPEFRAFVRGVHAGEF